MRWIILVVGLVLLAGCLTPRPDIDPDSDFYEEYRDLCEGTGGSLNKCPQCPINAQCKPCPPPCNCPQGTEWIYPYEEPPYGCVESKEGRKTTTTISEEEVEEVKAVSRVIDGDTFELSTGEKIRLICIDAPEKGEEFYEKSKTYLEDLGFPMVSCAFDMFGKDNSLIVFVVLPKICLELGFSVDCAL
ncbi:MAG: hypothetical protein ABH950_10130 [Candidatus Altiarchaeota archaeon]